MGLTRLSERVPPTGGLHADGFANILGRPALDPLTLVLRESGQNIWDARIRTPGAPPPRMLVRVRTLTACESAEFKRLFSDGDARSAEPLGGDSLSHHLAIEAPIPVLEICDFGTVGLSGGVDPTSEQGNFVRFFFDIGTPHAGGSDGGTYGYGRSSLYLAGRTRTILVDTQVCGSENAPRRVMACRLGPAYVKPRLGGSQNRYTGRHFWGGHVQGDTILPLEGEPAKSLAASLGMPARDFGDSGTSILIPWPDLPAIDTGRHIAAILLHNLWPKLVEVRGRRPMEIAVEVDGTPVSIPDPKRHPQYAPFAAALRLVRNPAPETGAVAITVGRSPITTGHMAIEVTHAAPIPAPVQPEDGAPEHDFARGVSHVALMRPSELVVRYLAFPGVAPDTQWGGVFMCSNEPTVRDAFAASEPPAHDDWIPDRLPDSDKTTVRVSLRRIREQVDRHFGINQLPIRPEGGAVGASLAAAADQFAQEFLLGDGTGATETSGGGGGAGGGNRALGPFRFDSIRQENGRTIARFAADCPAPTDASVKAIAWVITGSRSGEAIPDDISPPLVLGWNLPDAQWLDGNRCVLKQAGRYSVDVAFEGRYAIDIRHEAVEAAS
jgi:hypothetical protein